MKTMIRMMVAMVCMIAVLCVGFATAEGTDPTPTPIPTPSPEDLGELIVRIEGPEGFEPVELEYADFIDGKYSLDLEPGTYTVTEVNHRNLLEDLDYTFNEAESVVQFTVEVLPDETVGDVLTNVYERAAQPTPEPTPDMSRLIEIPVVKIWDDFGNRDGNRPERVFVNLLSDGKKIAQAVLSAGNGWSYTFTELPQFKGSREIEYTLTEEAIPMYIAEISGFTITNHYSPETTSATVSKVWNDNNNAAGLRPKSIHCTLSNGMHVELSAANNWTATIDNLPVIVNGRRADYTWTEQEVLGYKQTGKQRAGNATVFTNSLTVKGDRKKVVVIDEYGTPLGVEVIINHVGDCFD